MTHIYNAYTYLIGWTEHQKYYYGVRWANTSSPNDDLWKKYFTSSEIVREFRKTHGEPDIIKVDKVFNNKKDAVEYEFKYLKENNAVKSKIWLNQGMFPVFDNTGKKRPEHSKRMSGENNPMYGLKGDKHPQYGMWNEIQHPNYGKKYPEHSKRMMGENNPNYGKPVSDEVKEKISKSLSGENHPHYGSKGEKSFNYGRKHTKVECPHCKKTGGITGMKRWHFSNCSSL
jgi:hypothetical protein